MLIITQNILNWALITEPFLNSLFKKKTNNLRFEVLQKLPPKKSHRYVPPESDPVFFSHTTPANVFDKQTYLQMGPKDMLLVGLTSKNLHIADICSLARMAKIQQGLPSVLNSELTSFSFTHRYTKSLSNLPALNIHKVTRKNLDLKTCL